MRKCSLPFNVLRISKASSLFLGFEIILFSKSITLSAPKTIKFGFKELTLVAFISARFLLTSSGLAPSFKRLF